MKKWERASLFTLELNETANGFYCSNVEESYLSHTHNTSGNDNQTSPNTDPTS